MENIEKFEEMAAQIKQNQDEYLRLVATGHCAICLTKLELDEDAPEVLDTATCSDCHKKGWDLIFMQGVLCARELREWKNKNKGGERSDS